VLKRYSQLLDLKTKMENQTIRLSAPFPKKGFGAMGSVSLVKRREQLDAYMSELSSAFLPDHLAALVCQTNNPPTSIQPTML
jgi:hypothetical protein